MIYVSLIAQKALWREALSSLLSGQEDIKVFAQFARVSEATTSTLSKRDSVCVIDVDSYSIHSNLIAVSKFKKTAPTCRVLALIDRAVANNIPEALGNYAEGFLSRDTTLDAVIRSIRRIASGERVVEPSLILATLSVGTTPLSRREQEVLQCVMSGLPDKETAKLLGLAYGTVRNVVSSVLLKTGAHNRVQAITVVQNAGWL